ncbi:S1 family peptidase [Sphingomonas zeicaulis]|uniref:S1 family peptidase n=1 Tax=Sphingomonas zeicaulis TaxID=1632740 RepID=UPI003D1B8DB5
MEHAAQSVGRVIARGCTSAPQRTGTAFLWQDAQTVVTARHVVAGCSAIQVSFPSAGLVRSASPTRQLREHDLVLLRLDSPVGLEPLQASFGLPMVGSHLAVLGFALGAPTLDSKSLEVTLANSPPGSRLIDMLSATMQDTLRASGELNLESNVLRLDGNLLPGHSGAPLIDAAGRVRAIGSGGLQNGAGGIVWALRADYLGDLASGAVITTVEAVESVSGLSFAYQEVQSTVRRATCGAATFAFSRTLPLTALYETADDKLGLQQLAVVANNADFVTGTAAYDIWLDEENGASIAVPTGSLLVATGGEQCVVNVSPEVQMRITATDLPSTNEFIRWQQVEAAATAFTQSVASQFAIPLMPDPGFTYAMPLNRPSDGFVVRRWAYSRMSPGYRMNEVNSEYLFITNMARQNRFYGIASLRRNFLIDILTAQNCQVRPDADGCSNLRQHFMHWSASSLAVHLATIPPQ